MKKVFYIMILLCLIGCGDRETPAPVEESIWHATLPKNGYHRVQKGENLYSIAFRYDIDEKLLANMNHLSYPYQVHFGQSLKIVDSNPRYYQANHVTPIEIDKTSQPNIAIDISPTKHTYLPNNEIITKMNQSEVSVNIQCQSGFQPPYQGRLIHRYFPSIGSKGVDIVGTLGAPIRAVKAGVVAYSGSGLSGYGNLIIIKHDASLLTAYGHNRINLVKEGQTIRAGQVIAEMGKLDRQHPGLHFEVRVMGKPIDPNKYCTFH